MGASSNSLRYTGTRIFGNAQKRPPPEYEDIVQNKFCTYFKVNGYYYSQGDK
jgi:hypothetical protein